MASRLLALSEAMFCEKVWATVEGTFGAGVGWENWAMLAATGGWAKGAEKLLSIGAAVALAVKFMASKPAGWPLGNVQLQITRGQPMNGHASG